MSYYLTEVSAKNNTLGVTREEKIGKNFKRLRMERGWKTQEKLALDAGVTASYVSQIERGLGCFSTEAQEKWAAIFHCDVIEFFRDINHNKAAAPVADYRYSRIPEEILDQLDTIFTKGNSIQKNMLKAAITGLYKEVKGQKPK